MIYLAGIFFYIRNADTGEVWKTSYENQEEKYEVTFAEDISQIVKQNNGIETDLKITPASALGTEIRSLKIKNTSENDVNLEVMGYFRPVLSKMEDDISHPAFNNLFLKYSLSKNGDLIVKRNKRGDKNGIILGVNMFTLDNENSKPQYEIDDTKAYKKFKTGESFTSAIGLVTEPCVALKQKIKLKAGEEKTVNLVLCVSEIEEKISEILEYYKAQQNINQEFKIARAKAEEEARYLNLSISDLESYNMILPYIIHQNPMKVLEMEKLKNKIYKQSDFWKYGISGDIPLILVLTQNIDDIYVIREIMKVHENLRAKGIKTDLCILNYEKNVYEQYVKEQIIQEILNMQIGYLQNISGGIFLLNANEIEDEDLFKFKANIVIDASKGSLKETIKEMEEEYKKNIKNIGLDRSLNRKEEAETEIEQIKPNIDMENLKFYNGFGGFSEDGKEYIMKVNTGNSLPTTWSNVLANENFGTVVTNNMGGFTYSKNSRLNRITAWANTPANDMPSEIIYLKDLNFRK